MFRKYKNLFVLSTAFICLVFAGLLHPKTQTAKLTISKQDSALNFNNSILQIFSVGQKRIITDLLWITTLLESDHDHYKGKDLNSWIYQRFLSITLLDPKFLQAYQFGGQYLSIIKDDLIGAKDIYERGLKQYPDDYNLNYNAAFLYAFELKEFKRAEYLYTKIQDHPWAPIFIKSIIHKLNYNTSNDLSLTFELVKSSYNNAPKNSSIKAKLYSDLYSIKAEIDLDCLNRNKANCSLKDLENNNYIKKNGSFSAPKIFKKYKLN